MAVSVERELYIGYDNAKSVCESDDVTLAVAATAFAPAVAFRIYTGKSGGTYYATVNAAGRELLYPTATALPYQADVGVRQASRFAGSTGSNNQMWASINGTSTTPLNVTTSSQDEIDYGITTSVADAARDAADLRVHLKHASGAVAVGGDGYFKLYFWQYACAAQKAGSGVVSADVTDAAPYQGDSVTFTAQLRPGATWHGWYSDAACTQLVSAEQRYTTDAADLTLYARATVEGGTGLYVRTDGSYAEVQAVYKKINGVYVEQGDIAGLLDADARYVRA